MTTQLFTSYSRTNDAPTDGEVALLRETIVPDVAHLASLDAQLDRLLLEIQRVQTERKTLLDRIQPYQTILSPIRRIPEDILREIFVACMPQDRNCVMSEKEAPILLGRVCSSWRRLSQSIPYLWTRIHIVEPGAVDRAQLGDRTGMPDFALENLATARKEPCPPNHTLALAVSHRLAALDTWLSRSGSLPLSISFRGSQEKYRAPANHPSTRFLRAICAHSRRWKDVRLRFLQAPSVATPLTLLGPDDVPLLRTLSITPAGSIENFHPLVAWETMAFLSAPNLRRLTYGAHAFLLDDLPIVWEQLAEMEIEYASGWLGQSPSTEMLFQRFDQCPHLRTLSLGLHDRFEIRHEAPIVRVLNELESLAIASKDNCSRFLQLMGAVHAPHLRALSTAVASKQQPISTAIIDFLERCPNLDSFQLTSGGFDPDLVVSILQALPDTLRGLTVAESPLPAWTRVGAAREPDMPLTDTVLASLSVSPRSADPGPALDSFQDFLELPDQAIFEAFMPVTVCPNLEMLSLRNCLEVSDEAILALIRARAHAEEEEGGTGLRRFEISLHRPPEPDSQLEAGVKEFVDRGLEFIVDYAPSKERSTLLSQWIDVDSMF
ncbi:F-box domain-containing protein [Mycena chlorophos]|uniref:F-box domain-containing protein n=1 Tax=Mycena chlorophos TaxID=658473 RepID=A0A8H6VWL0_MYCCL|nr:F-box domain-containing protein [Mycena chlorophos]